MRRTRNVVLLTVTLLATATTASPAAARPGVGSGGGHRGEITVVEISAPDRVSRIGQLSERGHVTLGQVTERGRRVFRWYRGEMIELGPELPDEVWADATGVNRRGQVAGTTFDTRLQDDGPQRGFVWSDGVLTRVAEGPGESTAEDIDEHGRALINRAEGRPIGYGDNVMRAAILYGDREITSPYVLGDEPLRGVAMNNRGEVVGTASIGDSLDRHAFLWHPGRPPVDLGTLGAAYAIPTEVNDAGTVLGFSATAAGEGRLFTWRRGRLTDLGTLGGANTHAISVATGTYADRINERGQVVGSSETASGDVHAFLWTGGRMRDLGTLGGTTSYGLGVNDRGEVVGQSTTTSGETHAFLWRRGTMIDLGLVGEPNLPFSTAISINDHGQVLGIRSPHVGNSTVVLWETRNRR